MYNEAFVKPNNPQEAYDRDIAWAGHHTNTTRILQQIEIAAPDGKRLISDVEATALAVFLHKASINLVKKES
jgi:hypothetical protein